MRPRRVNDLVLAERRRLGVAKIRARLAPGARILDAGCGAGLVALDLLEHGYSVHGVDVAHSMLELCARRFGSAGIGEDRYTLTRGDVARAGLPSESFNAIVALGFLEYQEDELRALSEFYRLLAPRGTLVVSGPAEIKLANYFGIARHLRQRFALEQDAEPSPAASRLGLHRYSFGRFRKLLHAAGFCVEECLGHGFVEFEGLAKHLSYDAERRLHETLSLLARVLPIQRFGNDLMAVAQKPEPGSP